MRAPSPRQIRLLVIALTLLVLGPSIAQWQMGTLGVGLVTIGVVILLQRRRRATQPPGTPDRP